MPPARPRCRSTHRTADLKLRCELAHGHRGAHRSGATTWTSTPGPKPAGGTGYTVIRHVRLTPAQATAQDRAAGERDWTAWARDQLVAAAPVDE